MPETAADITAQAIITCPQCGTPVPITEALTDPLLKARQAEYESELRAHNDILNRQQEDLAVKERSTVEAALELERLTEERALNAEYERAEIAAERAQLAAEMDRRTQEAVTKLVAEQLILERKTIGDAEERRARLRCADDLAERDRDAMEKAERIAQLSAKLAETQSTEADLRRRQREVEDLQREFPLKVEQEVSGRLDQVRAVAQREAEQRLYLRMTDKDRIIRELGAKLEDASRKAHQGSQQAQGETLEVVLEEQLRRQFPVDQLRPVAGGEFGGDILHIVRDRSGRNCGIILWEFKRTKQWRAEWLPKLRADQRAAHADVAVIVSQTMPPDVQHFNEVDGVWVSSLSCTLPVAAALRSTLLQLASQKHNTQGQETKSQLVYAYLTGPQFRGRMQAIAERWSEMQKDLSDEKKATTKRWCKRETQLQTLLNSTAGIYGDLQGIAGRDLAEIRALADTLLLEDKF